MPASFFEEGNFGEAVDIYDRLLLLRADKASYMLNKAVCLVNMEEYEDALKLLYQLNYEHPDDLSVQRALAWALTCDGNWNRPTSCSRRWFVSTIPWQVISRIRAFAYGFKDVLKKPPRRCVLIMRRRISHAHFLQWDVEWLLKRGISRTDVKMMEDLIGA